MLYTSSNHVSFIFFSINFNLALYHFIKQKVDFSSCNQPFFWLIFYSQCVRNIHSQAIRDSSNLLLTISHANRSHVRHINANISTAHTQTWHNSHYTYSKCLKRWSCVHTSKQKTNRQTFKFYLCAHWDFSGKWHSERVISVIRIDIFF